MRPLRLLERFLIGVGLVLIVAWAGIRLNGTLSERTEIRRFETARREVREARPTPPEKLAALSSPQAADTTLWSTKRVKAYEDTLAKQARPPLAMLRLASIHLEVPVLDGTDDFTLNRAVGRIDGTAFPGQPGNVGIAGHRDGFFRGLKDVRPGDPIELETLSGSQSFLVADIRIVSPEDVSVLDPTPGPALTLVTCYPFYFVGDAPQRYIVRALPAPASAAAASR
jgi:sortase A